MIKCNINYYSLLIVINTCFTCRHSLLAAIVVSQINDSFGCTLKTSDLFANPTVNALAKIIKTGTNGEMEAVNLPEELKKFAIQQM